jgi:hypothetical protein
MKFRLPVLALVGLAALSAAVAASEQANPLEPTELQGFEYTLEFFPGARYDASVPTPESLLGSPIGQETASLAEIQRCLEAWDEASPRTRLVEYARSHEDRPLHYMIVTSPENLERIEEVQRAQARLADPRGLGDEEAERILESQPAVAWLAYSIHGNETSGADAALAVLYHLTASKDSDVRKLLEEVVVFVDPVMNPDGRHRYLNQKTEDRGTLPNVDDQSLLHTGYWPSGRMNHYLFDMNRDWILAVHPETRGRIRAAGAWHPLLFVDAHEMGSQDTYLFSPPREPVNPHFPPGTDEWMARFAREQAAAFDRMGWLYYTGEWNEGWYPGYSNSWAGFRGAVGILYEQARVGEDAVRRTHGELLTYRQSVHHQVVSSMANIESVRSHSADLKRRFLDGRRAAVSERGPYASRTFAVHPTGNGARLRAFVDLMQIHGFELYTLEEEFVAPEATDQLGRVIRRRSFREGTILIPNRQPEAHLLAAMLEFDPRIPSSALARERKELLRTGDTRIYDITAWNISMLYGLEAYTLPQGLPEGAVPYTPSHPGGAERPDERETFVGYVIDGLDDNSVAAAARLMERGVEVRVANRSFLFDTEVYAPGSVVVTASDNARFEGDLFEAVAETAAELALGVTPVKSGLGEGELPDLGGQHFRRLEPPRVALLGRGGIHPYDFGAIWYTLDHRLGIRHTHLNEGTARFNDLRRYNVLVLPDRWFGEQSSESMDAIKSWVRAGGTLIAIGRSAAAIAREEPGLSQVRQLPDVLDKLDAYELAILREWMARNGEMPETAAIWSHATRPGLEVPWAGEEGKRPAKEELERRDRWQRIFMPQGAILAGRIDKKNWLTFGAEEYVPVLFAGHPVLMSLNGVDTAVRLGYLMAAEGSRGSAGPESAESPAPPRVGWAALPEGYELRLRMSGLLWPEAADRLANAAYLTRESLGRGQVILFASPPAFRGSTMGTARMLTNALVYGPGFGARHPIKP